MEEDKVWYYVKDKNTEYYTPITNFKRRYFYAGDGSKVYPPKVNAELLNEHKNSSYEGEGIFYSRTKESMMEGVSLPNGVYRYEDYNHTYDYSERLVPMDLREDAYVELGGTFSKIEKDISKFLENKKFYEDKNLIYKLGILLYGEPGMGKTVWLRKVMKELIPKDSVSIFVTSLPDSNFLGKLRNSLQDRLKVFIFEELASTVADKSNIEPLLNFLDGEKSVSNAIVVATTNFPNTIPQNIIDRCSRFDKLYEIEPPKEDEIKSLMKFFMGRGLTDEEVKLCKTLSVADLKEVSLLVQVSGDSISDAIANIKKRHNTCKKQFAKPQDRIGFSSDL